MFEKFILAHKLFDMFTKKKIKPLQRGFYMFSSERAGDALIFVEEQYSCYKFLYIPGASTFYLSKEDFENSVNSQVLCFVEQLPQDIYEESLMLSGPSKEIIIETNEN